jgi:hypothetical protein
METATTQFTPPAGNFLSGRKPFIFIILASIVAFFGALRADYYMDDYMFILNGKGDAPVERYITVPGLGAVTSGTQPGAKEVVIFEIIPTAFWMLTDALVDDPESGKSLYHLWNLLMHTAAACAAYLAGREVLRLLQAFPCDAARARAALAGALLFSCHPLASEPVNYAKCLNHVTEAFFGLLAVWQGCQWMLTKHRKHGLYAAVCLILATFSYFPGLAVTCGWLTLLFGAHLLANRAAIRKISPLTVIITLVVAGAAAAVYLEPLISQSKHWSHLRAEHVLTQSRIFWEYMQLTVIPAGLCSDHHAPWSIPGKDTAAVVALGAIGLLLAVCVVTAIKSRRPLLRASCTVLLLGMVPLLLRFAYVNSEIMVEYRTYPALPWLMLLAGCGIAALGQIKPALYLPVTASLTLVLAIVSMNRTALWQDRELLIADVIEKYPMHHRARTQMQALHGGADNFEEVLKLHREILHAIASLQKWNASSSSRRYEMSETSMACVHSAQWMIYTLASRKSSREALAWAEETIPLLQRTCPQHFQGDLSLKNPGNLPRAWPVLMARNTVRDHAAEIDAARAARDAQK